MNKVDIQGQDILDFFAKYGSGKKVTIPEKNEYN